MNLSGDYIIAIDGPAASGKGALGRRLAEKLGAVYLDTGKLYRLVGRKMLDLGLNVDEAEDHASEMAKKAVEIAQGIDIKDLSRPDLSGEEAGKAASIVSAIPGVRAALLTFQRNVANAPGGAVLDGRDIGTVVCPDADFKFFITATLEVRATRRFNELHKQDKGIIYASVLQDLEERDRRDSKRKSSPLVAASDAVKVDTTEMGLDEVLAYVLSLIKKPSSHVS